MATLGYGTNVRNAKLNAIRDQIDAGTGAGILRTYDGTQPSTCGTVTNLLVANNLSDPSAPNASGGVLTFNAISDGIAGNTGTATWSRVIDSSGTCIMDMDTGTSGTSVIISNASITINQTIKVNSFTLTDNNA